MSQQEAWRHDAGGFNLGQRTANFDEDRTEIF